MYQIIVEHCVSFGTWSHCKRITKEMCLEMGQQRRKALVRRWMWRKQRRDSRRKPPRTQSHHWRQMPAGSSSSRLLTCSFLIHSHPPSQMPRVATSAHMASLLSCATLSLVTWVSSVGEVKDRKEHSVLGFAALKIIKDLSIYETDKISFKRKSVSRAWDAAR